MSATNGNHQLEGKVALITGATGGIGEATAKLFLKRGAQVMLVGRSEEKLKQTYERLGNGKNLDWFLADAGSEEETAASVAATLKQFGGLDILFANAGTEGPSKPVEKHSLESFETVLRTNLIGVWLAMKHSIPAMKQRGNGSIVAVASVAGVIGLAGAAPYIASKHAVCGLVKTAALELGPFKIRVNAVAPGPIDNRMMRAVESQMAPDDPKSVKQMLSQLVALKRYGTNEEVAKLAAFLASDESSYCTGSIHMIDGGLTAA